MFEPKFDLIGMYQGEHKRAKLPLSRQCRVGSIRIVSESKPATLKAPPVKPRRCERINIFRSQCEQAAAVEVASAGKKGRVRWSADDRLALHQSNRFGNRVEGYRKFVNS